MNFFDEETWGPIVNELDRRTRYWLQARQAAWQFFTEAVRELLKDEIAISMKLVVEVARHNARKGGISVQLSNSYTTYIRNLICMAMPEAEKYLTGGQRVAQDKDELSLED